jgi:hypothetical protein
MGNAASTGDLPIKLVFLLESDRLLSPNSQIIIEELKSRTYLYNKVSTRLHYQSDKGNRNLLIDRQLKSPRTVKFYIVPSHLDPVNIIEKTDSS